MTRKVVITGAASGIGASCVTLLKARGDYVIALDVAPVEGADRWLRCDLSDAEAIGAVAEDIEGPVDVLINNAGLPPRPGNATKLLAVNVFGVTALTVALESKLTKGASVISTASRAGSAWADNLSQVKALLALDGTDTLADFVAQQGIDDTRAYNLSKEAVIVWSFLQTERFLSRGIRINTVSPAPVATGIMDDFVAAFGAKAHNALNRVGRAGTADEIAEVIVFLAEPASAWINGQDVIADGGMAAMLAADQVGLV